MKTRHIYKIKPGMILAGNVHNRDGRLLFSKGQVLSEKELKILKMWGVTEAKVKDTEAGVLNETEPASSVAQVSDIDPDIVSELDRHLEDHFQRNDLASEPASTAFTLCRNRLLDQYRQDPDLIKRIRTAHALDNPGSGIPSSITPVKDIRTLFEQHIELPALPTIFSEINDAVHNPSCSGKDIADIVSKDTSLSAKLLKIINSAYYGPKQKIESLAYAAIALGTHQISSLALGISVINYFSGIPNQHVSMKSFWKHSIACAISARTLAGHISGLNPERVFIGGILHDIGRLLLLKYFPDQSSWLMTTSRKKEKALYMTEPLVFGVSHAELGSLVAETWGISDRITELIRDHHGPFDSQDHKETLLIHVSDWLTHAMDIGASGEHRVPALQPGAWNQLGVSTGILDAVIQQIDRQVNETIQFFYE
ncbi:MAG: HDOD domain-containing protein [Desulfobacteraceae bacterium]|nr:MAG: HDOD domain-containing protein [Desulfobacteraceae bacterium]